MISNSRHIPIQFVVLLFCSQIATAQEIGRNSDSSAVGLKAESSSPIIAGFGTKECHIGMPVSSFGREWDRTESGSLLNRETGIFLIEYEGRVIGACFNYQNTSLQKRFSEGTDKGVTANDSVIRVQEVYGEPSTIELTTDSDGANNLVMCVDVSYKELGIEFHFQNGKLATISVAPPKEHFDYEHERKTYEDFLVYVRRPALK